MPNKLTDTEIKKALEWHLNEVNHCDGCPLFVLKNTTTYCVDVLMQNALDLINRLQAENERLKENYESSQVVVGDFRKIINEKCEELKTAKAEAYKECIEKIQNQIKNNSAISAEWLREYLYNLLKELVGETDG